MTETRRTQLKKKVEAGQARNLDRGRTTILDRAGERAIGAKDRFVEFAKEHPVATIAGGVALGVLVSSLFKRSPTRRLGSRAAGLATVGAELALSFAQQAMQTASEAGREGARRLDDIGDTAREAGRGAAERAGDAGGTALAVTRAAGRRLGKAIRNRIN